ncbi:hypothetical protein ACJ72_04384 [Emergomyces africanus]|uniref:Glutaredoxin domain-containing protein n=1 Tax=Emergomyces africanus TaxID=1955775 RepID=A0A1B7NWY4_9EURO|nr:hypothetical protein ACJ72_04384 [Emergomyces africanus]
MFRFHKTLDVITLFHKPSLPASTRVLTLLKQANVAAAAAATADQASDVPASRRSEFELNVTEDPPTPDQLKSILDYVGAGGARDRLDALRRLKEDGEKFVRPVVVDWNNGTAVIGDNESEILKLVREIPPDTSPQ